MPREAEISLNEREFIKRALKEQIRLDKRTLDAFRPLELTFGDEYGVGCTAGQDEVYPGS